MNAVERTNLDNQVLRIFLALIVILVILGLLFVDLTYFFFNPPEKSQDLPINQAVTVYV